MPQSIVWNDFSAGWIPSDNDLNGRKNGLLQFDNCELDENGAIVLSNGASSLSSSYTGSGHTMYSRYIGGSRYDYVSTTTGNIYRNGSLIIGGGHSFLTGFGSAFDFVLYCSGSIRKKDNGSTSINLGVLPATAPPTIAVSASNAPYATIGPVTSQFAVKYGGFILTGGYIQLTADSNGTVVLQSYQVSGAPHDTNTLNGVGGSVNIGYGTDTDYIVLAGFLTDPTKKSLQFDVILAPGNTAGDSVSDYYTYVVKDLYSEATYNADGTFSIKMRRSDFVRNGAGQQGWSQVYGYRITFQGNPGEVINIFGNMLGDPTVRMVGGSKSQYGSYQYMQVNVNNTGSYLAKSSIGTPSALINIDRGQALITPINPTTYDAQCNEAWIYRRIAGKWYRVLKFAGSYTAQYDTLSDEDAIKLDIVFNENLVSVANIAGGIQEDILAIVGPIEGRWFYFTNNFMYPSEINNPDLVDPSIATKLTGSNTDKFLWAYKIAERTVMVGTTVDIYLLTGTFVTAPDFTVDIYYDGMGCEYPPITPTATENSNGVFYLAKDGWRVAAPNGTTQNLIVPNTDRLYDNKTCYGYPPVNLNFTPGSTKFPVVLEKNKLWCFVTGTGRVEVYDFARKYWRVATYPSALGGITAACSTQNGRVLAFFNAGVMREIDDPASNTIDNTSGQLINLKSLILDNDTPYQRKDTMNMKINCYTGGQPLTINVINDQGTVTTLATISSNNPIGTEFQLDLSVTAAAITTTYQIYLTGTFTNFKLLDVQLWFETRPVPVSFMRIQSLNYGNAARKRLYSIPFQIDTRGNNTVFTPIVDGIAHTPMNLNSTYKQTFNYKSLLIGSETDIIGKDFEYTLYSSSGVFEFFGLPDPRVLEVLPDPIRSFIIPRNNYGSTSRKRIRLMRFVIDTKGGSVVFTPIIDGVDQTAITYITNGKTTVFHYFLLDQIGVDWGGRFDSGVEFEMYEVLAPQPDDIEIFPDSTKLYVLPVNNFGTTSRKRVRVSRFILDTKGQDVSFTPIIDRVAQTPVTYNTQKQTVFYYYTSDQIGVDFSGRFSSTLPFEVWAILPPQDGDVEVFPDSVRYHVMPVSNYGTSARKRIRLRKFVLEPKAATVTFTPIIDGIAQTSQNYSGPGKRTCYYYYTADQIGVDFSGIFSGTSEFELWGIMEPEQDDIEKFPDTTKYAVMPVTNFGTTGRKRLRNVRFILDPLGGTVTFQPIVDGANVGPAQTFTGTGKKTYHYYYTSDVVGIDFSGTFSSSLPFELWGILPPEEADVEPMPDAVEYMIIPPNNYGTDNKKHLRSMSFMLDTHGYDVRFTPIVDGAQVLPVSIFNTNGKTTVTHYFTSDVIGVDFGGILESLATPKQPFEVWQIMNPGDGDITPVTASALFYDIEKTNFASPNKKRVRVWPFQIDTHGHDVTFSPTVDCQPVTPVSVFNTTCKKTVWHFFNSDVFGVDYGGSFSGTSVFDLYQIMAPDIVQVLPIARRFDQVGPVELFRYGKIKQIELRVLPFNSGLQSSIPLTIYFNDNTNYQATFIVDNNKEASYFIGVPKGTAGNIVRLELGPTAFNFHRFYLRAEVNRSGFNTEMEWVTLQTGNQK